jgi:hypothetical protein
MDPSLPIEDLKAKLNIFYGAYVRSINFFGLSSKVDIVLPYGTGDWAYKFEGENLYDYANGFGDMRVRFSFNFVGSPALKATAYQKFQQKSIVGYSLQVVIPTGDYNSDQLPNLGSNRWAFKNQFGISQKLNNWLLEGYVTLWLFTANNDFLSGNKLSQDPLLTVKAHLIRSLPKGFWISVGAGYGYGGRTYINSTPRNAVISSMRVGFVVAMPINPHHSLKLAGVSGFRFEQGPDFDGLSIAYQYRWNRK